MPAVRQTFVVIDEAWAPVVQPRGGTWLQASWKLSRAFGVANVAVLHRVTDLHSVGASDSEQVALAKGLLADSKTRGSSTPSRRANWRWHRDLLSLSSTEAESPATAPTGCGPVEGRARQAYLVQHRLSNLERTLVQHRWCHGGR